MGKIQLKCWWYQPFDTSSHHFAWMAFLPASSRSSKVFAWMAFLPASSRQPGWVAFLPASSRQHVNVACYVCLSCVSIAGIS